MQPSRENKANHPLISDADLGRIRKMIWGMISTIRGNMERFGKNASHETERSMEMFQELDGDTLKFGIKSERDYLIKQMETGIPPQTADVPSDAIYEWSKQKGIDFTLDYERCSFAYFVSRKIWKEGTLQYREGRITTIYTNIYNMYEKKITEGLLRSIKNNLIVQAKDYLSNNKKK